MNSTLMKALLTLSLVAAASDAWAACSPGSPRPGINYKGVVDNAVVEFSIETGVGNKLDCVLDGIGRWNGTNGVHVAPSGVVTNATAIVHLKCCMDPNHPQYGPNVVAFVNGSQATRSPVVNGVGGHITAVDMMTGPNWNNMLNVANCDTFAKIMAHEVGHVFGIGHTPNGTGSLMQGNIAINPDGSSPSWNGSPNECEKQRAAEALTAETGLGGNPAKPDWACEDEGFPGVADSKNCCNRLSAYTWTPSNIKPTGHITTLNGTVIPIGGSGTFTVHADDLDGEITRVGWYVGGNLVYTAFSEPWSFPYSNAAAGQHSVSAAIYDTADVYVWSTNTITVNVGGYFATDTLQTGEHLFPGYVLVAPNQAYYAQLGSDGRFNLYTASSALIASSWTYGPPLYVRMNEDGNAVVRHQPFVDVFQTGTGAQANAESGLRVLNSGSLAVVRMNGTIVWQYP